MKIRKIGSKIILIVLPIMIIGQGILTIVSSVTSERLIDEQMEETMLSELNYNQTQIDAYLEQVKTMADSIAISVANTYGTITLPEYEKMLGEMIQTNDIVLGSGLWFEPYVYDPEQKYVGPYIYKDGNSIVTTYDYSNEEYDYFNEEYYTNAMSASDAVITDPYYDETSGTIMSSCSAPINVNGKKIGCVTVDIELTAIQKIVSDVHVGDAGTAILTTSDGTYLAGVEDTKIGNGDKITNDSNQSLAEAGKNIVSSLSGTDTYTLNGEEYNLYYASLEDLNWKFIIQIPHSELMRPVYTLMTRLVLICIAVVVIAVVLIIIMVGGIAKSIKRVQIFAGELASGDFTISRLLVSGYDEIANMSTSLNEMYGSNKTVIENISEHANDINEASTKLSDSANELKNEFDSIAKYMAQVNEAMMNSSAATEELNASAEQVDVSVNTLTEETQKSLSMAKEINNRASTIEKESKASYEKASVLKHDYEEKLAVSIESAKVVEDIKSMAAIISDIADQITLLSLNASIEAARAGDQGRGFAVVATEIGKLAGEATSAVENIQATIVRVQSAFQSLAENANNLLSFVTDTVTPDYRNFVNVANQYGQDAADITKISQVLSEMSAEIHTIMDEITHAINNIAESTQETADVSTNILESVDGVSKVVTDVTDMAIHQHEISNDLNNVVQNFKLK